MTQREQVLRKYLEILYIKQEDEQGHEVDEPALEANPYIVTELIVDAIYKAMEEHASKFAEWVGDKDEDDEDKDGLNPFMIHKGKWIQANGNSTSWTTKELYNIFDPEESNHEEGEDTEDKEQADQREL